VSTARQGASGLGLEAQREAVARFTNNAPLWAEFEEVESGKRNDRPKLAEALALCKKVGATLVIAKLDRLARNVHFISGLMESGVDFRAVDFPEANRLTLHILAAVAEHEAAMISQRTKAALAATRARGTQLGGARSPTHARDAAAAWSAQARARKDAVRPAIAQIRKAGIATYSGIAEALNARGIKTPRGGEWTATQVRRVEIA
jgi:DNA invertase Pin-like site-specific DNA recombinase